MYSGFIQEVFHEKETTPIAYEFVSICLEKQNQSFNANRRMRLIIYAFKKEEWFVFFFNDYKYILYSLYLKRKRNSKE